MQSCQMEVRRSLPSVSRFILALLVSTVVCQAALAQTGAAASGRLERVGFSGYYKVGRWTPARITFDAPSAARYEIVAHAPDPDGSPTALPHPVRAETIGRQEATLHFKNGRLGATPRFELLELDSDGRRLHALPIDAADGRAMQPALRQSAFLVAVLGSAAGLGEAGASGGPESQEAAPPDPEIPLHVARLDGGDELPTDVLGFDSLDVLLIAGRYELGAAQTAAVREWVRLGGHLVVSVGSDVERYRTSSLGRWLSGDGQGADAPVPLVGTDPVRLRELTGFESFVGQNVRIEIPRRESVAAARIAPTSGAVLVRALGDRRLAVRLPYGLGRITFLAVDLDRPPLSEWAALPVLMHRLLGIADLSRAETVSRSGRLAHSGITDLASQLARAQQEFPGVRRSSLWTVMGLLVVYLLLIGPLDYLVVHRLLGRPHATWVTFPLLVAAAAALAGWTARSTNGERVRVNRVDLVDIDGQFQSVRTRSWMTLYTPVTRRYALAGEPAMLAGRRREPAGSTVDPPTPVRVSWSGTPENVFGGMYRSGGLDIARPAWSFGPEAHSITNLPVTIWATKDLEARWHNQSSTLVEGDLSLTPAGQLRGRFTHHLPVAINDWVVAVGRRVYLPGRRGRSVSLAPGTAWPADAEWETIPQRDLTAWLTGTTAALVIREDRRGSQNAEEYRMAQRKYDPFDPSNPDPLAEIVRMITFHRAAGGKTYTGLDNHALREDDLSDLLDLDRAVLFGRVDFPATEFQLNGEPVEGQVTRRATFVRLVLPVKPAERE